MGRACVFYVLVAEMLHARLCEWWSERNAARRDFLSCDTILRGGSATDRVRSERGEERKRRAIAT